MEAQTTHEETLLIQTSSLTIEHQEIWLPLNEVEAIIEYEFKNKHLLEEAFTHKTCRADYGLCYNRLEYLGDAVLNLLIVKEQFFSYPNLGPGDLSSNKSKNVDTEKLARAAIKHGLERYLRHKQHNLEGRIQRFTERVNDYSLHSNGQLYAPKTLADIVESTIGAVFIDSDSSLDIVGEVAKRLLEPIIKPDYVEKNYVSRLHEVCQKKKFELQFVDKWGESTSIDVFINKTFFGSGSDSSKKDIARYRAAKDALDTMDRVLDISTSTMENAIED